MGNYSIDKRAERELGFFLDKYFYQRLKEKYGYDDFKRVRKKEEQIQGVDVVGFIKGRECVIDEKASLRYMDKDLKTFSFELSFMRNGEEFVGWFLDNRMKTQYYVLMYPKSRKDIRDITSEDFDSVEILVVPVHRIWEYLNGKGLTKESLKKRAEEIRGKGRTGRMPTGKNIDGVYISATGKERLEEAPINLIIRKGILAEIASGHFLVTREKIMVRKK